MHRAQIIETLSTIAKQYPQDMVAGQESDIRRIAFHIETVVEESAPKTVVKLRICDIGGGIGLFSIGCAALGFGHVTLVDDFGDHGNREVADGVLRLHRKFGVHVHCRDIVQTGMDGLPQEFDVITSFDSVEHWHHSPKRLFREAASRLIPGGLFVLGAPNCVNLRKRISVPLGYGKWSSMQDWYEQCCFRGHVREPDVDDLKYIARDIGLKRVKVMGRNWLGYGSPKRAIRWANILGDLPLRAFPSMCSDIYIVGIKP